MHDRLQSIVEINLEKEPTDKKRVLNGYLGIRYNGTNK